MKTGAELITEERQRQIEVEGYDANHDAGEFINALVDSAISYSLYDTNSSMSESFWPWDMKYFKPKDRQRNLVRAGALIAAAIDRLQNENNMS